jgi:two-component system phosphate regulon sensor histidine kinase PhoR
MKRRSPAFLVALGTLAVALLGLVAVEWNHRRAAGVAEAEQLRLTVDELLPHAAELFAQPPENADLAIRQWTATVGLRVTLISVDGQVHADSWTPPGLLAHLGNQLGRPEIVVAARGGVGVDRRRSETTGRITTYAAEVIGPVEHPVGFLRLAREEPSRPFPFGGILVAIMVAVVAGWLAEGWADRRYRATVRHLVPWTELPPNAELEAVAADADRRFRTTCERFSSELDATRTALERVAEGVVLLDREGIVRFANAAAVQLLGAALTIGRPLIEAVRAPEVLAAVRETLTSGGTRHTGVTGPEGVELVVRVGALEHPSLAVVVVLRDVREERQLERGRRALVADLAHELRTPLTVLLGLAEELSESGTSKEITATLMRQVAKLRTFAEELEELARIESGQLQLRAESVDAATIVGQVLEELRGSAENAGVMLIAEGGPARLTSDSVRLAQVLTNLVNNSIRYNRPGGHVTVGTGVDGGSVRIEVEDDGIGIPAGEIGLVFQRFYRVRRQAEREGGSGLGLAIVKHLVRALGGTVNLASREGRGTTVTLLFPVGGPPA